MHVVGHADVVHEPDRFGSHAYAQSAHGCEPATSFTWPAEHAVHGPAFGPVKPGAQRHCDSAVAPVAAVVVVAGHAVHDAVAVLVEYVPTGHTFFLAGSA